MRILLAPSGSRGDFQPMLALGVRLQTAGHDVRLATGENFRAECQAFGLPFVKAGMDVRELLEEAGRKGQLSPLRATALLARKGRDHVQAFIRDLCVAARGVDVVVGAGAQPAAPTAADAVGVPYWFVAYTPQVLPSAHHAPFTFPFRGLPGVVNHGLWWLSDQVLWTAFGGRIQEERRALGLPPVGPMREHFFPSARTILACEPELVPVPPDVRVEATGSLELPDARPLPAELAAFIQRGPAPLYIGFGSMTDTDPEGTTRILVEAVTRAGVRAVISQGWAGLNAATVPDHVFMAGPVSHGLLFPNMSAVIHHGGAGTTAAAARAGKPQLVVPFIFDQIEFGARVHAAGLGPAPLPKGKLTVDALVERLRALRDDATYTQRAEQVGRAIRGRDGVAAAITRLEWSIHGG